MHSILVIRLSAMGDVAMTAPVVESLVKKYPDLRITVLTNPFFRPFFRNVPGVEFVDVDLKGRHKGFFGILRLYRDMKRNHCFDMVADLHDVLRTKLLRMLFRISGTKMAVIDKGRKDKRALSRVQNKEFKQLKPTPQRYADVFAALGFDPGAPTTEHRRALPVPDYIAEAVGEKVCKWIGIAPFAQHRGKVYPLEKMEKVAGMLASMENTVLFIFGGGAAERRIAEDWQAKYPRTISVIGQLSLGAELDLISNLDCMVSMDSAAMHMASLTGTPVVSIWGATHTYMGFMGIGQTEDNAVQVELSCRPCSAYGNKPCARGDYACMNLIEPEDVVRAVVQVLEG